MFLKFVKPVVVCGVSYTDGQTVPESDIPTGSVRPLIRSGQAVRVAEEQKNEPGESPEPVEPVAFTKPASKKTPK